ncbi:hypothetical protein JG687_00003214 [Phytophthora cactorum]|uniref:Uncharacterized protein n=1 Tax=Phytophthora cactorum TaxID=29920 RepID=A0A329SAI9_9STRA|nr:hypothetical protein Pcac1_g13107 [Phytophthora cactorum]KAG2836529.1 hypothetical protein PC112_g5240 [Phytophthora cactorum]KAG2840434.1 hypothetical protein PC111_g3477 [Phytophthora cactorum]KAG2864035.1 hypothetical protein PC113_g4927 [Phytophthora cactorum]KAG2913221.1 hypothetical protein PC114_g8601 [Phytophthora cactorum]
MEFARRFSHTSEMLQATTFKDARQPGGLHVDTSNNRSSKASQEPQQDSSPISSPELGPRSAPSSTHHMDAQRRRRSHSECLLLAKNNGTQDLPGPCAEYISNVKQMLARNDDQLMQLKRRRSMNLGHPSLFK